MTHEQGSGGISGIGVALLAVAATALGAAINIRDGLYSPGALLWLDVAVLAAIGFLFVPRGGKAVGWLPYIVLACALAFQFTQLYRTYPGTLWNVPPAKGETKFDLSSLKDRARNMTKPAELEQARAQIATLSDKLTDRYFKLAVLVAAALSVLCLLPLGRVRWGVGAMLLALQFAMGMWMVQKSPDPFIDVYHFQQEGSAELLRGRDPYAMSFQDIYYPYHSTVYASDLARDGRLLFGYPYMPVTLLLAVPGSILGDVRYAHLAAITLAAALIALARPGMLSTLAALLLLFTPRSFMVVQMAWTEPFLVFLLAATVFCALRFPRGLPIVLGLFLASKQYMLFGVPAVFLLAREKPGWKEGGILLAKALAVALVVSLPLILWNVPAFTHSAVTLQFQQPFRKDALSYLAFWAWNFSEPGAARMAALAFVVAAGTAAVALWKCPKTPAGFAAAIGLTYLAFFAFNKQAFCNYYFFVIGALCCAIAAAGDREQVDTPVAQAA